MDRWAWSHLEPWVELRARLPVGRLFCVVRGPTRGRPCAPAGIRKQLQDAALTAGVRRRFAPHQLRQAHAVEMSREGISLLAIQRQRGHADLAITSRCLRGIGNTEIIQAPSAARTDDPRRSTTPARALIADCLPRQRACGHDPTRPTHVEEQGAGGESPQVHASRSRQLDRELSDV